MPDKPPFVFGDHFLNSGGRNNFRQGSLLAFLFLFTISLLSSMMPEIAVSQEKKPLFIEEMAEIEGKAAQRRINNTVDAFTKTAASSNFDIHRLKCEWNINPAVRYIKGNISVFYTISAASSEIVFDLVDDLVVDSVFFHDSKVSFSRPGNHSLAITLPATLSAGQKDSIHIFYQGVPPSGGGLGSFVNTTHAGIPVNWTLSEPYGSREWWPCKNGLNDKTDSLDIYITTPETFVGVSNGLLQSEVISNGEKTTHWKHRYPIATYLVAIAATNYVKIQDTVQLGQRVMPLISYAYPEGFVSFRNASLKTRRALRLFHETFGEYPFINEKYGHTQFSWGGGMEHQTNSFMVNTAEELVVHEAAHQWFGNKITCGSWQHIWLNEGFASYLTNYSVEKFFPQSTYFSVLRSQLNSIVSQPNGSVFVPDTTNVSRIFSGRLTYTKGAWLLHMLRWKLGDPDFFNSVRTYLQDPAVAFGYAVTDDLIRNLEKISGKDLTEFFNDWFYGEGYPGYQYKWSSHGNGWVQSTLSQTTSHPSVSFFEMPVPIRFWNASRDTILVIDHQQNNQNNFFNIGFVPDSAAIDPFLKLISAGNTVTKVEDIGTGQATVLAFPNPVHTDLSLLIKNFPEGNYSISLLNSTGQLLWNRSLSRFSGTDLLSIPTSQLPKGIYWIRINGDHSFRMVKKILK